MEHKEQRDEAEGDLIDLIRRNEPQNFAVEIVCQNGHWIVTLIDYDIVAKNPASGKGIGYGNSFTEAWTNITPTWAADRA
jgi:hypothetical protein